MFGIDTTAREARQKIDEMSDRDVQHPAHYNRGKIEVADFIADQGLNFDLGNVVKYVCRTDSKDDLGNAAAASVRDLKKAAWYLQHEIQTRLDRLATKAALDALVHSTKKSK